MECSVSTVLVYYKHKWCKQFNKNEDYTEQRPQTASATFGFVLAIVVNIL